MSGGWQHTGGGSSPWTPSSQPPAGPDGDADGPRSAATPSRPGAPVIRPMPAQTTSFEAIARKSALPTTETARFEVPEPEDPNPPRRRAWRAPLVVLMSVALIGVVAGVVYVTFFRKVELDPSTVVTVSETPTVVLASPQEAVRGYLEALAAGDIQKAMTFGPRAGSGGRALLQPQAHKAMPAESRPSQIRVITEDPRAAEVAVSYMLDGQQVETNIPVVRDDAGSYSLRRTTVTIQLQLQGGQNLPMLVNGTQVENGLPLEVVPGSYKLSTGLPFIDYPDSEIRIQSLAFDEVTQFPVDAELTPEGKEAFLGRARASLTDCLASKELAPARCPNKIAAPKAVKPGSVQWSLQDPSTDPWNSATVTLSSEDKSVATVSVALRLKVEMSYQDGSTSGRNNRDLNATVTASMLGRNPGDVQVTWG